MFALKLHQKNSIYVKHFKTFLRRYKTGNSTDELINKARGVVNKTTETVEETFGLIPLKVVQEAQDKVVETRNKFNDIQKRRRQCSKQYDTILQRMDEIVLEVDKVENKDRGSDNHLNLLKQERAIMDQKREVKFELERLEQEGIDAYEKLTVAISESHEKERMRSENSKTRLAFFSAVFTILSACLGFIGSYQLNKYKMSNLYAIVQQTNEKAEEYKSVNDQLITVVQTSQQEIRSFLHEIKGSKNKDGDIQPKSASHSNIHFNSQENSETLKEILENEKLIGKELSHIKEVLGVSEAKRSEDNVVYVGPEVKDMLDQTESNIEWKLKMNTLTTVTFIYGAMALTVPVIMYLFKGD